MRSRPLSRFRVLLIFVVVFSVVYLLSHDQFDVDMEHFGASITPLTDKNRCVIILSGYSRILSLASLLVHYAHMELFRLVIVSWGRDDRLPSILRQTANAHGLEHKVELRTESRDDLNLRFALPADVEDDTCVFVADDDIYVPERDVLLMYATWKRHENQIVGAFPRSHFSSSANGLEYISDPDKEYSIVLTKFMVISSRLLEHYTSSPTMSEIRSYVRVTRNCEDIAINMMATALSNLPPVHVSIPEKIDFGGSNGLYKRSGHMKNRSECVKYFAAHGGALIKSSMSVEAFRTDSFEKGTSETIKYLTRYMPHRRRDYKALVKEVTGA